MKQHDLKEVLEHIDPAILSYQEWVNVGMALKEEGYTAADWDAWSARDRARYRAGECFRKWDGFGGTHKPVTGGTVVQYAMEQGWMPAKNPDCDVELAWDASIGGQKDEGVIVNPHWLESKDVPPPPKDWTKAEQVRQLTTYLESLFEASETVGYVTECWEKDGRFMPNKGAYDRTAGELIELLGKCKGDLGSVIGDCNPQAGAWIRFNPLDGKGVKNENVTEYRYALVESDSMEIDQQFAILHEMELPIAMLVHSGKKSVHAIVRINAGSYDEYRRRVDYLYEVCAKNGLKIDTQNRNPSRLSRMPGITRNGQPQYIIAKEMGKGSWDEWREWIESVNDDLPEPESMRDVWDHLPELSPPLIDGVLRQGHKMLLAGPSKAGKSYALIELCIAIAEGQKWLGWSCAQGRVLYVNLELDRASCLHRFRDVYSALGWPAKRLQNIDIWNLRGKAIPMDKLAPKLIRRAAKRGYIGIVIDPIYKVITGDENSADQMANFCNQFDKVCTELGCAVIYCHHHSKGTQGQKRSMDRASGSGVFARDPDAMLDMIELDTTEELRKQTADRAYCDALGAWLDDHVQGWREEVSQDDQLVVASLRAAVKDMLPSTQCEVAFAQAQAARAAADHRTAWRVEGTLREFARFEPVNLWFAYPVHLPDENGALKDVDADGEQPPWKRASSKNQQAGKKRKQTKDERFASAISNCTTDGTPTTKSVAEYLDIDPSTVRKWISEQADYFIDKNDGAIKKKGDGSA